jgi:hypothetical protein
MKCKFCNTKLTDSFCKKCDIKFSNKKNRRCKFCNNKLTDDKFCNHCGIGFAKSFRLACPICHKKLNEKLQCSNCQITITVAEGETVKEAIIKFEKNFKRLLKPKPIIVPLQDGSFEAIILTGSLEPISLGKFQFIENAKMAIKRYSRKEARILKRRNTPRIKDNSIELARKRLKQEIRNLLGKETQT